MRDALKLAVPALLVIGLATGCSGGDATTAAPAATVSASSAAPASSAAAPTATTGGTPATAKTKTTGAAQTGTKAAACRSADLKTAIALQPDGTATAQKAMVVLTNDGKSACTLDGWVAISLVNAADEVVAVPTKKVNQPGPAEAFTVKPGTSAFAGIKWVPCDKADGSCGVGNTMRYNLEASTDGPVATLEGFPAAERSGITMKSLQIGTLQPSNQGVVAW
ncbi:DUF4232 domain-containing protein [Actinoplanes sp. L3-i22]|uniref:DUF4232 domain-containing protein n=1 Tax=Actinoplanes sp. L3-i22 TaxID=2836373 RepID=UPI001C845328|nr:DUF4232 domain-containing protein [Actinoplanes sp. L3-i22]